MRDLNLTFDPVANTRQRLGTSDLEARGLLAAVSATLFVVLVANQTHIETVDAIKLAPRLELFVRLAGTGLAGLIGLYGLLCIPRVQRAMLGFPGIWVTCIAFCYILGTAFSNYKSESLPHLATFGCIYLFAPVAFVVMGTRHLVNVTLWALLTTLVASWFLYLMMPEYGVVLEVTDGDTGEGVLRMGGTSHPNTLAGVSGFVLMIVCFLYFQNRISLLWCCPIVFLCLATYVFTQTRMAAVGAVAAIVFAYRDFWYRRSVLPVTFALLILGTLGFLALMFVGPSIGAEALTRSGDVEEITSFTGRSQIWAFVLQKIGESPVVGYGPGVAKILLDRQDMLLHPHNVILSLSVVGGVFCGLFGIAMFVNQLAISVFSQQRLAVMISVFVIVNSLTETFIFDYIPGTSTLMWLFAIYWPALSDDSMGGDL